MGPAVWSGGAWSAVWSGGAWSAVWSRGAWSAWKKLFSMRAASGSVALYFPGQSFFFFFSLSRIATLFTTHFHEVICSIHTYNPLFSMCHVSLKFCIVKAIGG